MNKQTQPATVLALEKELRKAKRKRDLLLDEYNKRSAQLQVLEKEVNNLQAH